MIEYKQLQVKIIMLETLKTLCVLLKVSMLTRVTIATLSENLENDVTPDISVFQINDHNDHYMLSNISSDIVTVLNKADIFPSQPTFPRAFVDFGNRLNEKNISVTFRWKQPEITNGKIEKYRVQYWFIENMKTIIRTVDISATQHILQYKAYNLTADTMYYFEVQAHNEVGAGPYTNFINVSTTHENPVPLLLTIASLNTMKVLDIDLQISVNLKDKAIDAAYSEVERKIYWINYKSELMTCDFDPNAIEINNWVKIIDVDNFAYNLRIDWVARNLYWLQKNNVNQTWSFMKLDLALWQTGKYDNILQRNENAVKWLNILPSTGYLYWMESISPDKLNIYYQIYIHNYLLMQSDFNGKNIKPFLGDNLCSCLYKRQLEEAEFVQSDDTNVDKPLIYWISVKSKKYLIATDIYGCNCKPIITVENSEIYFSYLTIDKINLYLYNDIERVIYILEKKYALLESKENALKYIQKVNILLDFFTHKIKTLSNSIQRYPPTKCLIPDIKEFQSKVFNFLKDVTTTANSIVLNIPESVPIDGCKKYNLPTTIYNISVSYQTCLNNDLDEFDKFHVETHERHYEIQNLTPLTTYTLKIALSNFYVGKLSMGLQFGEDMILKTTLGKLNAPENVTVQVLTPSLAVVYWMPPKNINCVAVTYEVHWISTVFPNGTRKRITLQEYDIHLINQSERAIDGKFFMSSHQLVPGQEYLAFVRVYPVNFTNFSNDSSIKNAYTYPEPNNLTLSGSSINSINISWNLSDNITYYTLKYSEVGTQLWQIANNTETYNYTVEFGIENLLPGTLYKFRLILKYCNYEEEFIWPSDGEFNFKTRGDVPSAPGVPTLTRLQNFTHQLNWESVQTQDSEIILYLLEGLIVKYNYKESNQTDENEDWNLYYNGTENYWVITKDMNQKYQFRVRAQNAYGLGNWSKSSKIIDLTEFIEISVTYYDLIIKLTVVGLVIAVICTCCLYYSYRQWKGSNNEQVSFPTMTDIELSTLYEIPYGNVQFNALYASGVQFNRNEFTLTIVEKQQIILAKLVGSGAFGKVFQGTVKDLEGSNPMPVAIKMLRKNASSQQITEFLREAKLMSHFRHTNVLRLLGICMDADSPWLILELMETDLLEYLRESRTLLLLDSNVLRLQDLLAMCEDVARGCSYLEKLHFVHRDLACRNCLISSRNRENRIVKIGDFGLTRDLYKNQYYRTKGGLLPVRWMAPESLVGGIFTLQSDVWSFGVLMWEIMSLGEQPYPARDNLQVLEYVRSGGKLPKPLNCPPTLYELMQLCWNTPNDRPKFAFCLNNIVTLRNNIEDAILSSIDFTTRAEVN
ncbi:proto-oncogene tyrosine-protein kinase ROS-like [Anoplolepis gracilipes]|uniref:proto-oncogene tyrosine-protein kinase ROS-like n=1 Tax=Anoplolepis gracilipes TaxID=354296 RepID=UPI003BA005FE